MAKLIVKRELAKDLDGDEISIYPDGDTSLPRIGVLKLNKGMSNLILDEGQLPYRRMNEGSK